MSQHVQFLTEFGVFRSGTDPFWSRVRIVVDTDGLEHWVPPARRHLGLLAHRHAWRDLTEDLNLDPLVASRPLYRRCGQRWCVHPAHLGRRRGRSHRARPCGINGCTNPEHTGGSSTPMSSTRLSEVRSMPREVQHRSEVSRQYLLDAGLRRRIHDELQTKQAKVAAERSSHG